MSGARSALLGKTDLHHGLHILIDLGILGIPIPWIREVGYATIVQEFSFRDLLFGIVVSSRFYLPLAIGISACHQGWSNVI